MKLAFHDNEICLVVTFQLYSLFFTSAGTACAKETSLTFQTLPGIFKVALKAVAKYGGAERGDRTMVSA